MITTHTFTLDTSLNTVVPVTHHPFVTGEVSVYPQETITGTVLKLAALVDTSQNQVTTDFFVNHTGKPIGDDLFESNKFENVGYVSFRTTPTANLYGVAIYKLVPTNNKKYTLEIKLGSSTVSQHTMSLLISQILKTKLALTQEYISAHLATGTLVNHNDHTTITSAVSEDFFLKHYGTFVNNLSSLPSFLSVSFSKVN